MLAGRFLVRKVGWQFVEKQTPGWKLAGSLFVEWLVSWLTLGWDLLVGRVYC
jgi:hypothetical protein